MKDKSIAKFNKMTAVSFAIIAAVTVAMTTAGDPSPSPSP